MCVFNTIMYIYIYIYVYVYIVPPTKKKNDVFEVATLLGQITLFSLSSSGGYHIYIYTVYIYIQYIYIYYIYTHMCVLIVVLLLNPGT